MREVKFRAWDVNHKCMEEIKDLYWFEENGVHEIGGGVANGHHTIYRVMQSTGLKDKNGVKIYEGDLLKKRNYKDKIYKVVWTKHGFELRHDFIRKYKGDSWEETAYLPIHERDCEVIGNIYEHPHLLKEGNQ